MALPFAHKFCAVIGSSKLTPACGPYQGVPDGTTLFTKSWAASPVKGFIVNSLIVGIGLTFALYPCIAGCSPWAKGIGFKVTFGPYSKAPKLTVPPEPDNKDRKTTRLNSSHS